MKKGAPPPSRGWNFRVKRGILGCAFLAQKRRGGHLVKWELTISAFVIKVYSDFGVFVFFRESWQKLGVFW